MKPKVLLVLSGITAVVTVAAVAAVASRHWEGLASTEVRPFPGLLDKVNEVAEITIRKHDGAITLSRGDEGWGLVEKYNYRVQRERVRQTVIGIGDLRLTEPKTRKPERYARLGVEDIETEDARSKLVTLRDEKGETLAELIIGRPYAGVGRGGMYVRLPGEEQAWLAETEVEIPGAEVSWLVQRIIHVSPKRVARLTTVQPDGETLVLYKEAPDDEHFIFEDLPVDAVLKGETVADETGSVLLAVDLVDVVPESEVDFSGDGVARAEVATFDGLVVKVEMIKVDGAPWARFNASFEPAPDQDPAVAAAAGLKGGDEVAAEAGEINARLGGWAYRLDDWRGRNMTIKLAQFLEAEEPEPPEGMGSFGAF